MSFRDDSTTGRRHVQSRVLVALLVPLCQAAAQPAWQALGPYDTIPSHQFVYALHRTVHGTLLALGDYYFLSTDGGATWTMPDEPPFGHSWVNIQEDRTGNLFADGGSPIFRSQDDGVSWREMTVTYNGHTTYLERFAIAPDSSLFGLAGYAVLRSTDAGDTWDSVGSIRSVYISLYGLASIGHGILVANGDSVGSLDRYVHFWTSTDFGATWANAAVLPDSGQVYQFIALPGALIARSSHYHLFVTYDTARSWQALADSTWSPYAQIDVVEAHDADSIVAHVLNVGLCIGSVRTREWRVLDASFKSSEVDCLVADSISCILGTRSGVLISSNGRPPWDTIAGMRSSIGAERMFVDGDGTMYMTASGHAGWQLFRSRDSGATWKIIYAGLQNLELFGITRISDKSLVLATYGLGLLRSTDDGGTWQSCGSGGGQRAWGVVEHPSHVLFGFFADSGMMRSTNMGVTWQSSHDGMGSADVRSAVIDRDGDVWAGSVDSGVFRSTDVGATWQRTVSLDTMQECTWIPAMFADSAGRVYATVATGCSDVIDVEGVWVTSDHGATWTSCGGSSNLGWIWDMTEPRAGTLVAVGESGVFLSLDGGGAWHSVRGGLPSDALNFRCAAHDEAARILVGTGQGVYRSTIDILAGVRSNSAALPELSVVGYPIPASSVVTIPLCNANASATRITVTDILGRACSAHVSIERSGAIAIDVSELQEGIYFCRWISAGASHLAKVVVRR